VRSCARAEPRKSTTDLTSAAESTLSKTLPTMTCGHPISVVTKANKQADSRALVETDFASHRVRIETREDRETIESAAAEVGYVPN
jgi:copper chaperone